METLFRSRPRFARLYQRVGPLMERRGLAEQRTRLLSDLGGRVLDLGAGDGRNLDHLPREVTEVVAVEPEPLLRDAAKKRATAASVPVEVIDGRGEQLDLGDDSVDAAVATLVLCSVDDQAQVLRELYRVLRPGGELRFLEHVRANRRAAAAIQRGLDRSFWPLVAGGCHTSRDTTGAVLAAGFRLERVERLRFTATSIPFPASPNIAGFAIKPTEEPEP